jgi:hypothetical protein
MLLCRRITIPQTIHIRFIEWKKLQSILNNQWQEYNFGPSGEAMEGWF